MDSENERNVSARFVLVCGGVVGGKEVGVGKEGGFGSFL